MAMSQNFAKSISELDIEQEDDDFHKTVLDDILIALEANGVGQREQEELLMANYGLRGDIVRV